MIPNDLFVGIPPVQIVWDFYMTIFRHTDDTMMTRAEIARQMGKSNATITKIVKKLQPIGLVTIIYDPNVRGTSKHVLTFFPSEILRVIALEVGFNESDSENLDFLFSNWIEARKLQPNPLQLGVNFVRFFHEPLWCDIAKEFPLFFFSMLLTMIIISFGTKDQDTGEIQLDNIIPIPIQLLHFFYVLFVHLGVEILLYLLIRFLTPEGTKIIENFLTNQTSLYESLKKSVAADQVSHDYISKLLSFVLEYNKSKTFWHLDEQRLYLNSEISTKNSTKIDLDKPIIVKIPLKTGEYQELSVRPLQDLIDSPLLKDVIDNGSKS